MRAIAFALVLLAGCLHDNLNECGTRLCPADTVCAPDSTCVEPAQLSACSGLADGTDCTYSDRKGHCRSGICEASTCGDAQLDSPEQCDGTDLGGATCLTYGYYSPDGLSCSADCSVDTSQCVGKCGDGIKNGPELCDTTPGDAFTCYEVGFDYGSVSCSPALCAPVYEDCITIGWREGQQNGDYSPGAYAPHYGEVYIVNAGGGAENYLHVTGVSRTRVLRPNGCDEYNSAIWASDAGEVFLTNTNQVCEHVGNAWTMWPMPQGVTVNRLWGTSGHDVYAVGSAVMHFDGSAWSTVDTGAPAGVEFVSITGRVGGKIVIGTDTGGLAIYDNGWTYEVIKAGTRIASVWTSPNGTIYAVGEGTLYTKTGSSWAGSVPAPLTQIDGVWGVSDTGAYLHGSTQGVYSGVWFFDGQNTTALGALDDLSYFGGGPESLLAVAVYQRYYESSGTFFTPLAPTGELDSIWAFSPANILAFVGSGNLRRFDGQTWTSSYVGNSAFHLWAASSTEIFAVGPSGSVARSSNGINWNVSTLASLADLGAIWGEAANRVFAAGIEGTGPSATYTIFYFNGASWQPVYSHPMSAYAGFKGMWGSASAGTFVLEIHGTTLLDLPPGAAPTDWVQLTLPDEDAVGLWGADDQAVVTFSNGRAFSFKNGAWTSVPTRGLGAAGELSGPAGDVFGISTIDTLVHWNGTIWDRVRLPADFDSPTVQSLFCGNGVVVVGSNDAVSLLVRP